MNQKVIVINITDTTDRDALIEAEASNKYKTLLLSSVSHELRTPLNGSINFIEQALNDEATPANVKEKWLTPAIRSNHLLLALVNDILDFSQMQSGKLRLIFEPKSVLTTVQESLELLQLQAEKKNLKLTLENNLPKGSEVFETDHNRLKQVMINLLSNAVKFTFEGNIVLSLDPIPPSEDFKRGIKVSCRDTGVGMSPENQKNLFQTLEKLDFKIQANISPSGAGLGLVISSNIVQRLSPKAREEEEEEKVETIHFESEEGVGSTFYFNIYEHEKSKGEDQEPSEENSEGESSMGIGIRSQNMIELAREIPLRLQSSNSQLRNELRVDPLRKIRLSGIIDSPNVLHSTPMNRNTLSTTALIGCNCPKMLIVDDDTFNLMALNQILLKLGIPCHWAYNGKQAIEKIVTRQNERCSFSCQQYKAMFLDCNMPIMDGLETAKVLRQMIKNQEIDDLKIICCTAFVQQSDEDKALAAGMDEFCTKPINVAMVKKKLKRVGFLPE